MNQMIRIGDEAGSTEEMLDKIADYYNEEVAYCNELEAKGQALLFRPDYPLVSMEKNIDKLQEGYDMGYRQAMARMVEIKAFCGLN